MLHYGIGLLVSIAGLLRLGFDNTLEPGPYRSLVSSSTAFLKLPFNSVIISFMACLYSD